jgi:hypothetical protein
MSFYTIQHDNYTQPNDTNNHMHTHANIQSNWKYRQYMQQNANEIMKYNTMQSIHASGNNPYSLLNTDTIHQTPHVYRSIHDTSHPPCGFIQTDLKQEFINKQQLKSRMVAPSISTQQR